MAAERMRPSVELRGVIKHAYPLETLGDDTRTLSAAFSLGRGPCGHCGVHKVVAWEVQLHILSIAVAHSVDTCYVFLYDAWADAVQRFQRHFRVHLRGTGLVAVDHWDVGHDTEDVQRCFVVAEPQILRNANERSPRLLPRPTGTTLEIQYEEPQSLPDSDQLMYLPMKVLRARDLLHPLKDRAPAVSLGPGVPRPNARGKRQLAEYQAQTGGDGATGAPYMYTKLSELIPGYANVYGVVVNASLPKRSEGSDFYMSVHVIDETTPRREDATQVMVFYPTLEKMPKILYVGDIVRFHKIKINRYQDRIQGVCSSPPYKEFTAARFIVWDGSGDDSTCRDLFDKLAREKDTVPFIPTRGLLMEIIIDSCWVVMEQMELLTRLTSQWCRFRNLAVASEQSEGANARQWYELHFREVSSVMLVPDFVPDVQQRQPQREIPCSNNTAHSPHKENTSMPAPSSEPALHPITTILPRHVIEKVPITAIRTVLATPQVPRKYRCQAKVVRVWPSDLTKICKPLGNRPEEFVYSFVVRLADATGELDVIVHGSDAENFVQGMAASDLSGDSALRAHLEKLFASLLSPKQPAIDCCIKSYRPSVEASASASVRYRLFDTRLEYK
ncbi:hypothetical protein P43SY_003882 [Pythium insidiosum]|uniref:Telomeric single stranded DNA binding POT1/Cdc13 domain-containing protein n=1 Tax=Pythium insidiosum TaxID=114742 RepID=A0AAD5LEC3_PYTIN|nr:hypothetical protein P43SY_003882 [Pythium insidiosum]